MTYAETSAMLSGWKKTDEIGFLNEVLSVPLQQALRYLQDAFAAFFAQRAVSAVQIPQEVEHLPATDTVMGVDAGIESLVTLSTREKITNPRHERHDRWRLARAQRELSRKAKGSNNCEKARAGRWPGFMRGSATAGGITCTN